MGVPALVQRVKNLIAAALVTKEAWVWSLAQHSGLKDLALLQLWCRSQLWLRFSPWPGNFHMPQMWLGKKKKKKKDVTFLFHPCLQRPRQWTVRTCTEGPCSVSPVHHPHSDLNLLHPPMTVHFSTHSGLTVSLGLHFHMKAAMHVKLTLK